MTATPPIPAGFHTVTPHLVLRQAERAIDFYRRAFGAIETFRLEEPDGTIAHAELRIGDSTVMVSEEAPERGSVGPAALGGSPTAIHLYVADVDATVSGAVELGAEVVIPVADQFYGDRSGRLRDPFGHLWVIATQIEEVAPDEMQRRFLELFQPPTDSDPGTGATTS